ncbi:MAG: PAS domain S-box protein [Anaerolineales bacterium]|uniref:PAS domain S-box protein n=1 Tax=Candidatus Villigracilis proximus TaxID=3140683 RepID=UPI003135622D|nr:PAS domain S-box protein [Anaerolineales bacterium]
MPEDEHKKRVIDDPEWKIIHSDGTPMSPNEYASVRALKEKRKIENVEMGVVKPDSSTTWINVTAAPLPLAGHGVVITYSDITESKQQQEALRRSEALLSEAQRIGHIGYWEWTAPGEDLVCSDELFQILEIPLPLKGRAISQSTISSMASPEDREYMLKLDKSIFANHSDLDYEFRIILTGGRVRWIHQQAKITYGTDGAPTRMMGVMQDITERRYAEEALHTSEMRFRSLIEHGMDNISLLAPDGTLLWESPATIRTLGYQHEQFKGHNIFELIHPDDQEWVQTQFEKILSQPGNVIHGSFRLKHSNGSWRWVEGIGSNLLQEPSVNAIVINYRDITERKINEEALKASEENYRDLVENSQSLICTHDLDGNLLSVNEAAVKLSGYSRETLLKTNLKDLIAFDGEKEYAIYLKHIHTEGRARGLMEVRVATGEVRTWAYNNTLRAEGASGNIVRGTAHDITERKRAEDALIESEERFHKAFRSSPVGMVITRASDGTCIEANETYSEITGFNHDELLNQTSLQLNIVNLEQRQAYTRQISEQGFIYNQEMTLRNKSGELRIVLGSMEIIELNHESCVLTTAIDITERKQAEAKVIRANRMYATISQINQAIVRAQDRDGLFTDICHIAINYGKFRMAWIGLTDETNGNIRPVIFAGEEQGYLADLHITAHDQALGGGPTGTAIREGRCVISQDIANDPHMLPWREQALKRGYRSSASVPLQQKKRTIGALTVYASDTQGFSDDDQNLLYEIAQDISYALDALDTEIERKQAEALSVQTERHFRALIEKAPDGIALVNIDGSFTYVSPAAKTIFGYDEEEIITASPMSDTHRMICRRYLAH